MKEETLEEYADRRYREETRVNVILYIVWLIVCGVGLALLFRKLS